MNTHSQTHQHHTTNYPSESAGSLLTANVPTVSSHASIGDIEALLQKQAGQFDSLSYIYVIDRTNVLVGVISIKELYRSPRSKPVNALMKTDLVTARVHTDQERVALLAIEHNIKAVPVIDKHGVFLGIVPTDTILNVLHTESVEDALRFSGSVKFDNPDVSIIHASAWLHVKKRLPWLVVGLSGGLMAALIVRLFETALETQLILAAFIPAVVYMADAVGTQTQTLFIRSLALTKRLDVRSYVKREAKVTALLATALGGSAFVLSLIWLRSVALAFIFGTTLILTICLAALVALSLPWLVGRLSYDPAIVSGPFATVLRDIFSLLIYFSLASAILL